MVVGRFSRSLGGAAQIEAESEEINTPQVDPTNS
jgi:hypothetical protein